MSVLLTCDAIEKSFGSRTVFSDISLSLHDGERLGIIGPNGAGKSTFLQILGGGMSPDDGTVSIRKGVRLAMVVQDPRFDPEATVREVIAAAARESEDKDLEVSKIISRVGFEDAAAKAGTLSGGWRKRLAIAAALARTTRRAAARRAHEPSGCGRHSLAREAGRCRPLSPRSS